MSMNEKFRRLFRFDNDHNDVSRAIDDELQFHFELAVRDLVANGATEAEARLQAEQRFGDVERTRLGLRAIDHARVRDTRRIELLGNISQDVRYALRGLRRNPPFAIAVVVILALGIGANATMFGIVDHLLLRTPSFLANADRVQRVYLHLIENGKSFYSPYTSYHRFRDLADSSQSIEVAAGIWNPTLAVGTQNAREFRVTYATASFWKLFTMRPALGRFYTASEDTPTNPANVAVLSYPWWQSEYGGADSVIGKTIRMGRLDYTIIGVTPKAFVGLGNQAPIAFVPLSSGAQNSFPGNGRTRWYETYGMNWMQTIVRRKPGIDINTATAEFTQRFRQSYEAARVLDPSSKSFESVNVFARVASIHLARGPNQATAEVKVAIWLVGVAFVVLLIACANVANLMLARAIRRQREIAVRLALGISRSRLTLQILVESSVLALLGGAAGLAVTEWGGRLLRATLLPDVAATSALGNIRTPLFTLVIAIAVGVLTGLVPAWRSGRSSLAHALKAGGREGTYQRSGLRSSLLVVQAAMSVVLLVGAGLFVRSLNNLQNTRLGFDASHIVWVKPNMRGVQLDSTREQFVEELVRAAQSLPGVESASSGLSVPFAYQWEEPLFVAGIDSVNTLGQFELQVVGTDFFRTMGTRVISGRRITEEDRAGAPRSIVVSASMAKRLWPGQNPLSKCIRMFADTTPCLYVVGVAEDARSFSLTEREQLQYYVPRAQYKVGEGGVLFVRVSGSATLQAERIRIALQKLMPGESYLSVQSLDAVLDPERRSWELGATMFTVFGTLALLVAGIGLYSVISYTVAQRTHEMGVRVALGAQASDVVSMILRQSVILSGLAVAIGVGVALAASKWVEPLLFETSARDPLVYVSVAGALLLVAVAAALAPALRAARVDASIALRSE